MSVSLVGVKPVPPASGPSSAPSPRKDASDRVPTDLLDSLEADSDIASSEQYRGKAREFVKKVVVAHANSEHVTSEESLDHGAACVLAARMWTYGMMRHSFLREASQ